ncbi:hypothetical protein Taro_023220 [Colocasia esculenta]|uniref:BHLH domain-containing protein n=1 Tax=Colocasia esculenta TaxID=4460 RepID=A0A843V3L9_COLES|nr:hypothetical protein [Colocasia esculenta]
MELDEHGFLEELLALRRETWDTTCAFPTGMGDFFAAEGGSCFDCCFDEADPAGREDGKYPVPSHSAAPGFGFLGLGAPADYGYSCFNPAGYCPPPPPPFGGCRLMPASAVPLDQVQSSSSTTTTSTTGTAFGGPAVASSMEDGRSALEGEDLGQLSHNHHHGGRGDHVSAGEEGAVVCKVEELNHPCTEGCGAITNTIIAFPPPAFDVGSSSSSCLPEKKGRAKKVEGQPSKNLMAERRRRKRLNDRLSMLRSVVPKISKMDRTSILGDTIDYMKELLERIKVLQEEMESGDCSSPSSEGASAAGLLGILKDHLNPEDVLVRNTPKFNVEKRELDTRVEICCAAKPGLLLSTVNTLEALGLEIQQCVVSCFNDFGMQASCSEDVKQRALISAEEIKQALFRNAGYGGRCV